MCLAGSHVLKAGLQYNYRDNLAIQNQIMVNKYSDTNYTQLIYSTNGTVSQHLPTVFLSDSWSITSRVRLNLGVRWEPMFLYASNGVLAQKILDQVAPRVGLIYTPDEQGLQKISLSAGRFYQTYALMMGRWYFTDQMINSFTSYNHNPIVDPSGGSGWSVGSGILPGVKDLKGQYEDELTIGYERQIMGDLRAGSRLIYRRLGMGLEDGVVNLATGEMGFGNPGYGPMKDYPKMKREFVGLELTADRSFGSGFSFQVSYTLSRLSGNYPGLYDLAGYFGPENSQFDHPDQLINADGLLPYDRTHIFKLFGLYKLDVGLSVGASIVWETGTPLSIYGAPVPGFPEAAQFIGQRGTAGRTPSIWDANFRFVFDIGKVLGQSYQARLIADVFHFASEKAPVAFDEVKYFGLDQNGNPTDSNPNYGKAVNYQSPMSVRLGLEVNFR